MSPEVRIFAVNYRTAQLVPMLLQDLRRQREVAWEIVLVDNSEDPRESARLVDACGDDPRCSVVVSDSNMGYMNGFHAARTNAEFATAGPPVVTVMMNVDMRIPGTDVLSLLVRAARRRNVGVVAPTIWDSDGRDLNPYLERRPNRKDVLKWRLMFSSVPAAQISVWASSVLRSGRRKLGVKAATESTGSVMDRAPRSIYAPHGGFVGFSDQYFRMGGRTSHPVFLFSEEFTIAEECRRLQLAVHYDPGIVVDHADGHASTTLRRFYGLWKPRRVAAWQVDAMKYSLHLLSDE